VFRFFSFTTFFIEVLRDFILAVVLTNSPISIESVSMEITGDFKELIKNVRQSEPVKLFEEVE